MPSPLFFSQDVYFGIEFCMWSNRSWLGQYLASLYLIFSIPLSNIPTLSPANPSSSCFLNISTPVTTVVCVALIPTISIVSLIFTFPRSILPVTTVPRPLIEKTSSTGIKNGLSSSRTGSGIYSSTFLINSKIASSALASPSVAFRADPRIMGTSLPGNPYLVNSSRLPFPLDPEVLHHPPCHTYSKTPRLRAHLPVWPTEYAPGFGAWVRLEPRPPK